MSSAEASQPESADTSMRLRRSRRWASALAVLTLVIATLATFHEVVGFEFVTWDDPAHLFENPLLTPGHEQGLVRIWSRPYFGLYVPLSYSTWWGTSRLSDAISGNPFDPRAFHALSLGLHLLVVLGVGHLLTRLGANTPGAVAGALLFALHPVQVESVAWVSEARGLLCAACSFAAMWCGLESRGLSASWNATSRALEAARFPPRHAAAWRAAATVAYVAALLAKPSAVVLPLTMMAMEITLARTAWRDAIRQWIDWLLLAIGWSLLTSRLQPATAIHEVTPWLRRPLIAGDAAAFYIEKLVWPAPLSADYGRTPSYVAGLGGAHGLGATHWLVVAAVLVAALCLSVLGRRNFLLPVLLGALPLAPVLGLLPFHYQEISTVADRYLYFAMVGPALALAWTVTRSRRMEVAFLASVVVVLLCGRASFVQARHWRDSPSLWTQVLRVNPRSSTAHVNLGVVLQRRGDVAAAAEHFAEAARQKPSLAQAHIGLGDVALQAERFGEAAEHYARAAECDRFSTRARSSLASARLAAGDRAAAIEAYRESLQVDPRQPNAANFLARLLATTEKGRQAAAIEALAVAQQACQLSGFADPYALDTLAAAQAQAEQYAEALRTLDRAEAVAQARGDQGYLAQVGPRRQRYRQRQPLRESRPYVE